MGFYQHNIMLLGCRSLKLCCDSGRVEKTSSRGHSREIIIFLCFGILP